VDKDSVIIDTENDYKISKNNLKETIKDHPYLIAKIHPNFSYQRDKMSSLNSSHNDFNSEVGQDDYYLLYAYLLKSDNKQQKFEVQRKTLKDIYTNINHIYQQLAHGGTYFGHQYSRIPAFVEYAIYVGKDNEDYLKGYNISKQKTLYINSLRQLITDELSIDFDSGKKEKLQIQKDLYKTVNDIDRLITNYFYLKETQEFQYSNY
jgi:hypothetical protein